MTITETLTIETNKALANDLELQTLRNSSMIQLLKKYSSNIIEGIRAKFKPEKEAIRNQIASLDSAASASEYQSLMSELNSLKDEEERLIDAEEKKASEREEQIQLQNDSIQSRLEAVKADNEELIKMRDENIKDSFGYFKS